MRLCSPFLTFSLFLRSCACCALSFFCTAALSRSSPLIEAFVGRAAFFFTDVFLFRVDVLLAAGFFFPVAAFLVVFDVVVRCFALLLVCAGMAAHSVSAIRNVMMRCMNYLDCYSIFV